MKKVLFGVSLLLLSGCAGVFGKPTPIIQVTDGELVKECQFLGSIRGPESNRMGGTPYLGNFKNEALAKAEKMGATHTLSTTDDANINSFAVVNAYKCLPGQGPEKQKSDEE